MDRKTSFGFVPTFDLKAFFRFKLCWFGCTSSFEALQSTKKDFGKKSKCHFQM